MHSPFRLATKYLHYYITASSGKGHGIHSPFVFDFITNVLRDKRNFYAYTTVESARMRLKMDNRLIDISDFGAGSVAGNKKQKRVAEIVQRTAKSKKLGQLLFRIVNHLQPVAMIELGTSLGISSAYLAFGNPSAKLVTIEGDASIAAIAKENFSLLKIKNIESLTGNFDNMLEPALQKLSGIDLAFIDGNHRKEPTLSYFEQLLKKAKLPAVLIFDDIHWSSEMEEAWQEIKSHGSVLLTIDLFFIGLVFLNTDFKVKQHFVIRF